MYKVKDFAGLFGVSVATLHHYEKLGLLLPHEVNTETGYRYYDSSQLGDMSQILQLKNLGFSLKEIQEFKNDRLSYADKLHMLNDRVAQLQATIEVLEMFEDPQPYKAFSKKIPAHWAVSTRKLVANYQEIPALFDELAKEMAKEGIRLKMPPHFYCRFYDTQLQFENNDVEACLEIVPAKSFAAGLRDFAKEVETQTYLCALHYGDYLSLGACYEFLEHYAARQHIETIGHPVESYIESYGTKDEIADFITEVRFPVAG